MAQLPIFGILIVVLAVMVFGLSIAAVRRYKRCPSNQILVKYGKVGAGRTSSAIHGGATFVWPLIQDFSYLDLTPLTIDIDLRGALSKQNIRINIPSRFTIGISTTPQGMNNAAERLLGLSRDNIEELAKDIIFGQLRATIATLDIEEINADRDRFEELVTQNIETELTKVGLVFINVNITDIEDESGYIEALGKQAAAEATNRARAQVADQDREGATKVAEAERQQRVAVAQSNAQAETGENQAQATIAASIADRRVKEAEGNQRGEIAEVQAKAEAERARYAAQQQAEQARAEMVRVQQQAEVVVPAEMAKEKQVIEAQAAKEQEVLEGQAHGEARRAELEGEAAGAYAILAQKAKGFEEIVAAAGGDADAAARLMIVEQLPQIAQIQAAAIANIKFDKVVVMDSGGGQEGASTTAQWLSGLVHALPGLHEVADMTGLRLPELLGERMAAEASGAAHVPAALTAAPNHGDEQSNLSS